MLQGENAPPLQRFLFSPQQQCLQLGPINRSQVAVLINDHVLVVALVAPTVGLSVLFPFVYTFTSVESLKNSTRSNQAKVKAPVYVERRCKGPLKHNTFFWAGDTKTPHMKLFWPNICLSSNLADKKLNLHSF